MNSTADVIIEPEGLAAFASQLAGSAAIGIDTEFMRERTYRAELCLVQAANPDRPVCIDPLALPALEPLVAVLGREGPLKVLHAARQDLEVLWTAIGPVAPVFDTQIAAALAGFPAQIGYADLARELCGAALEKAHTRTDWSRRPLRPEQIAYALDDVRYLLPLREALVARLANLGRSAWLAEELAVLADPRSFAVEPDEAWRRLKGLGGVDAGRMRLARTLAAWRERRAIARNRPRGWILDDSMLREIVLRVPRDTASLGALPEAPANLVKHCGDELLSLVNDAAISDPPPPLPKRERPDPALGAAVKRLSQIAQDVAKELQLAAEVLVTRRDLEKLASGDHAVASLSGWRRAVVGEKLLAAL